MKRTNTAIIVILLIVSLLPLLNLLHPGLPVTHDGQDHVARIANFYQSVSEGSVIPRWAGNLNWGYGHPVVTFLYPLPSYIASLFHFMGFSFVDSTKLVFGIAYSASLLAMFFWLRSAWGVMPAVVGAVLYGFAPYRFVDLYVRGAIGEHVAFVFPPLILLGLLQLARSQKQVHWWGGLVALSSAGLILSHNALSLIFFPIVGFYALYLIFFETKNQRSLILYSLFYILLGFGLAAFYWIPALLEGKYTLRDIVTVGGVSGRFVPFIQLVYSQWNYGGGNEFSKFLGFSGWAGILVAWWFHFSSSQRVVRWFMGGLLSVLTITLFLMTQWSAGIWNTVSIMQKFQFPWRLLSLAVFITSVMGAAGIAQMKAKLGTIIGIILIGTAVTASVPMWQAKEYRVYPESFFSGVYEGTTDTGESSPIWSVRFMEKRFGAPLEVVEGNAQITPIQRFGTSHTYKVEVAQETRLVENTLYFPGWQVLVDGAPVSIQFQDPQYRGLMTFRVKEGTHAVETVFVNTRLREVSEWVSGISLIFLALFTTIQIWRRKK